MTGINKTEAKYWIAYNAGKSKMVCDYSPIGSQTSFGFNMMQGISPEKFDSEESWIDRLVDLGMNIPEKYL